MINININREDLISALFEAKKRVKSLETTNSTLKAENVKCVNEMAKQQRKIEKLTDSSQNNNGNGIYGKIGQNQGPGSGPGPIILPPPTAESRREIEKTIVVRQLKAQITMLRGYHAEKEIEVENLKRSQKGTKLVELSNEKEEFYLETLRLKQVVRELRDSLQSERQKRAWEKKKNGTGDEIRKEVARLTSGYQDILKGFTPGTGAGTGTGMSSSHRSDRPVSASLTHNNQNNNHGQNQSPGHNQGHGQSHGQGHNQGPGHNQGQNNSKRPQSASKSRPLSTLVNAANATTLNKNNASGSSLMAITNTNDDIRVIEPLRRMSRPSKKDKDYNDDNVRMKTYYLFLNYFSMLYILCSPDFFFNSFFC